MTRIATFAAFAALLAVAAPAGADSLRIATAGKSPAQVKTEVEKAAYKLCARETVGASFPIDAQRACVREAVRDTMQQYAGTAPAEVASR